MSDAPASAGGTSPSAVGETGGAEAQQQAAGQTSEQKAAQQAARLRFKAKIDGQEEDVELDEDTVKRDYQKWRAADKKFQDAARMMKEMGATKAEIEAFKKDPWAAVKAAGQDPYKLAEALLLEKIEYDDLSPAERRAMELERELNERKARDEEREKSAKEREREERDSQAAQEIDEEIGAALKAMGRRPTPRLIARVAETLIAEHERQIAPLIAKFGDVEKIPEHAYLALKRLPASEAVSRVHKEYLSDITEFLGEMPIDEVAKLLPKKLLDGLREREVKAVLSQDPAGSRKIVRSEPQPARGAPKRMTSEEFFKQKEKKWG